MIALALASLRHRATASAATFVTILFGTVLMGSFATLVETATSDVSATDRDALVTMGAVVGGWGALIVLFAVVSTVGITVTQRTDELRLLRTIGTTPRQARRLLRGEVLAVAAIASVLGAVVAWVAGRGLLALLRGSGIVSESVGYGATAVSPALTALVVVAVGLLGATIAGRRATRPGSTRRGWWRPVVAVVLIGYGVGMGAVTVLVTADSADPYAAMQTSGSCSILVALGLAALAPWLLRHLSVLARPLLRGSSGHLAAFNTRRRSELLAGVLAPVIVLTSAATGTLMLVGTDARTRPTNGRADVAEQVTLLNNVVVAMIVLFAAVVVVNSFAAVVAHRRAELHRLWLLGATPDQVRGSVLAEAGVVAGVGVVLGTLASLATVVPFGLARDEGVVPDGQLWLPVVVVAGVVGLTVLAARSALRRAAPLAVSR